MKRKKQGDWKLDENGKFSNRSLAEMIVCSLYHAKPRIVSNEEYERAIDVVEEELTVAQAIGETYVTRQHAKHKDRQPGH